MKTIILALATLALTTVMPAQDRLATSQPTAAKTAWTTIAAWPIDGCVVSGQELKEGKAKTFEVDGRTFKTCCGKCQAKVEKDPAKYGAKLDEAIVAAQLASYPLETCVLTDKKLGATAKNVVLDETLIRVCCGRCEKKAPEQSELLVAQVVAAAHAAQAKSYPLTTCPISGEKIDDKATEVMYGTTLVRFCCDDCVDEFRSAPAATLAKLEQARSKDTPTSKPTGKADKAGKAGKDSGQDGASSEGGSCCSEQTGAKSCCSDKAAKPEAKGSCCEEKATPKTSQEKSQV